ncbi:hypothetical protein JCM11491_007123 [Sporobolomyces phaffii]
MPKDRVPLSLDDAMSSDSLHEEDALSSTSIKKQQRKPSSASTATSASGSSSSRKAKTVTQKSATAKSSRDPKREIATESKPANAQQSKTAAVAFQSRAGHYLKQKYQRKLLLSSKPSSSSPLPSYSPEPLPCGKWVPLHAPYGPYVGLSNKASQQQPAMAARANDASSIASAPGSHSRPCSSNRQVAAETHHDNAADAMKTVENALKRRCEEYEVQNAPSPGTNSTHPLAPRRGALFGPKLSSRPGTSSLRNLLTASELPPTDRGKVRRSTPSNDPTQSNLSRGPLPTSRRESNDHPSSSSSSLPSNLEQELASTRQLLRSNVTLVDEANAAMSRQQERVWALEDEVRELKFRLEASEMRRAFELEQKTRQVEREKRKRGATDDDGVGLEGTMKKKEKKSETVIVISEDD